MQRLLVSGAGGFVGSRIMQQLAAHFELCSFPQGMLAQANEEAVCTAIAKASPNVVLHTAAISDTAYSEAHPEASYRANVALPMWMARGARQAGAKLVCFSSDQVYGGEVEIGPFSESLPAHPINVYGRHKLEAEQRVLDLLPEAVMLRATWMYDFPGYGLPVRGNLLLNLLAAALRSEPMRFSRNDYRGVTYVRHAIELLPPAMRLPGGVYNFGSENHLNMVETARDFSNALGLSIHIEQTGSARSLAIDCSKLRQNGISFLDTQAGLRQCLRDYGLPTEA